MISSNFFYSSLTVLDYVMWSTKCNPYLKEVSIYLSFTIVWRLTATCFDHLKSQMTLSTCKIKVYIYIYFFFSNFVDSKCMFVFISFHHQVFFCRKWLQGYMLGCSSDDVILLTLVTQPAFACSNSTIETPNLFKINNTDIYEQLLLKPIKAYLGPCLFAKTVID